VGANQYLTLSVKEIKLKRKYLSKVHDVLIVCMPKDTSQGEEALTTVKIDQLVALAIM